MPRRHDKGRFFPPAEQRRLEREVAQLHADLVSRRAIVVAAVVSVSARRAA